LIEIFDLSVDGYLSVWLSEIIEASDIEEALKQASVLALKRRWNLNGVEEQ
jgi:hypothetical protein